MGCSLDHSVLFETPCMCLTTNCGEKFQSKGRKKNKKKFRVFIRIIIISDQIFKKGLYFLSKYNPFKAFLET